MDLADRLVRLLPEDGTPKTNRELREALGVPEADYWTVRNRLLDEGIVTKLPGRGGRTALVPSEQKGASESGRRPLRILAVIVLYAAAALLLGAVVYVLVARSNPNWLWNGLGLAFGAVTLAAGGLALLIFILQEDAGRLEANNQATLMRKLTSLTETSVQYSSNTAVAVDELKERMNEAVRADLAAPESSAPIERREGDEGVEPDEPVQDPKSPVIESTDGKYYRPSDVPLFVVSDLVRWWDKTNEQGRWTFSRLFGGFRAWNKSGNTQGVPWVLTFQDNKGALRSFRLYYGGKRKDGPHVSELLEGGVWQSLPDTETR